MIDSNACDLNKNQYRHEEKKTYKVPQIEIKSDIPEKLMFWLYSRKITEKVIRRNKISHSVQYFAKSKINAPCLAIPYLKNGKIVGVKYRMPEPKEWTAESGAEPTLYGYDDIKTDILIWTEGEFDKLAVEVAGFENCVSVPNGAGSAGSLDHCKDQIKKIKTHIIAVDNDSSGTKLKNELISRLNPARCKTVEFPEGCKDSNDVLIKHGPEILKRCIDDAVPVPIKGIVKPSALLNKLIDMYRSGNDEGLSTGWENVDKLYRVVKGQWTVITGIPNHGKSEWLDALLVNMIINHAWKFGIFSPENYPLEKHVSKYLRKILNRPFGSHFNGAMSEKDVTEITRRLDENLSFIATDQDNHSIDSLIEIIESLILSEGIDGAVIDPWNTIEHNRPRNMTETEYVSAALTKITHLVRKYNIHLWVVAHPTKMQKNNQGKYLIPLPYDIAGSANWANKSDNAISIYVDKSEDRPENEVQIHVTKIRFRDNGQPGETRLYYDKRSGRYKANNF